MNTTTFFNNVQNKHGNEAVAVLRRLLRAKTKMASLQTRKKFLLNCRELRAIPKSLTIKLDNFSFIPNNTKGKMSNYFSLRVLNEAIANCFRELNMYKEKGSQGGFERAEQFYNIPRRDS